MTAGITSNLFWTLPNGLEELLPSQYLYGINDPETGRTCGCPSCDQGLCVSGVCSCNLEWSGSNCSSPTCFQAECLATDDCFQAEAGVAVRECGGNGRCDDTGTCVCNAGSGKSGASDCLYGGCEPASNPCFGQGSCVGGACVCDPGYDGVFCEDELCIASFGTLPGVSRGLGVDQLSLTHSHR